MKSGQKLDKALNYALNFSIKKVSEDVGGRFNFNTAISSVMELVNEMYKYKERDDVILGPSWQGRKRSHPDAVSVCTSHLRRNVGTHGPETIRNYYALAGI